MWNFVAEMARRVAYLLNRRKLDAELADEMAVHAEMRGAPIGNSLRLREESRDAWGWVWLDRMQQDVRYAFRTLRKSPGFVATSVLILALGIGVNLALFQLFDLVALRPVKVRDAETLVQFSRASPVMSSDAISYPATQFYKAHNNVLSAIITTMNGDAAWQDDASDRVRVRYVSANYFTEVGYNALAGRLFAETIDGRADAAPVAIVSDKFWQKRFANAQDVVGKTVRINDRPALVIGVTPEPFPGLNLDSYDVYLLIHQTAHFNLGSELLTNWSSNGATMYGRMRPGLSLQAVKDGLRPQVAELAKIYPDVFHKDEYLNVSPVERSNAQRDPEFRQAIVLGFALTALMLIASCANLSNLNLSRAQARHRELAIRASLGAGRWRVVRQLMTESLLIGLAGSAFGLLIGQAAVSAVLMTENLPIHIDTTPGTLTIVITIALAVVASVLVGLIPAMRASRGDLAGAMKEAALQATSGARVSRFRYALIGTQIAACTVFLIVAFLLARNVQRLLTEHPGFDYGSVAVAEPSLQRYGLKGAAARDYWYRFTALVKAHPEVTAVSLVENAPLGRRTGTSDYNDAPGLRVYHHSIDESFLQVMRIPLLAGRNFTSHEPGKDVVIISQALAQRMYDTVDVVGRGFPKSKRASTIVGVVADAHTFRLHGTDVAEIYHPIDLETMDEGVVLLARARSRPENILLAMRQAARSVDSRVLAAARPMRADFERRLDPLRMIAAVSASLSGIALLLASAGLFGLIAYTVGQRTKEIGIRMALGAGARSIIATLCNGFRWPIITGLVVGLGLGWAAAMLLRGVIGSVRPEDPIVYLAAVGVLSIVAVVAAVAPAGKALRINPVVALRND